MVWCVTEIQEADSAFIKQVVFRRWSYLHCLVICEITVVFVPTVHTQTNSEFDSWWLAHVTKHHRHMTNHTMDLLRTPDNGTLLLPLCLLLRPILKFWSVGADEVHLGKFIRAMDFGLECLRDVTQL